jgi:hypothetical protein
MALAEPPSLNLSVPSVRAPLCWVMMALPPFGLCACILLVCRDHAPVPSLTLYLLAVNHQLPAIAASTNEEERVRTIVTLLNLACDRVIVPPHTPLCLHCHDVYPVNRVTRNIAGRAAQ